MYLNRRVFVMNAIKKRIWSQDYKTFFLCLTQLRLKFVLLIKFKLLLLGLLAEYETFSANKYEMLSIVGIFIFIYRANYMLS